MRPTARQQSHAHHYVPRWYQRRFLPPGATNFYYLDLHPETLAWNGGSHQLKSVRRRGPAVCFYRDDLYVLRFGRQATDIMEKLFFGAIDSLGRKAVEHFAEYGGILASSDARNACGVFSSPTAKDDRVFMVFPG